MKIAGAPISWGVCEVPGWGYQMSPERVLTEMKNIGLTATEFGPQGWLPVDAEERAAAVRVRDGAIFGGIAYATYSLTGKAVLKDMTWPAALADLGWGIAVGAAMAGAAHLALKTRWARGSRR